MLYGIDFSFGEGLTTTQIKNGGKSFVCRYISGENSKDIDAAELANYKAAGIAVVFVWEADGIMNSESQGSSHAHAALAELDALAKESVTPRSRRPWSSSPLMHPRCLTSTDTWPA